MDNENEALFDPDFLSRLRSLFFKLRKQKRLQHKGIQPTPSTSHSREFKDHRAYTARDDYRAIDWRLFARLERLFIRIYEDIQEFHVHILIDHSLSMAEPWGAKRLIALRSALALAYLALVSQHRVSILTLDSALQRESRPVKGQGHIHELIRHLESLEFGGMTDLRSALGSFRPGRDRRGIVFLISDLFGRDIDDACEALRSAGTWPAETHVVHVIDPNEAAPDLDGEYRLHDVETGEERRIWLTRREQAAYKNTFNNFCERVERICIERQINYLQWSTSHTFEEMFLALLGRGSALASG